MNQTLKLVIKKFQEISVCFYIDYLSSQIVDHKIVRRLAFSEIREKTIREWHQAQTIM